MVMLAYGHMFYVVQGLFGFFLGILAASMTDSLMAVVAVAGTMWFLKPAIVHVVQKKKMSTLRKHSRLIQEMEVEYRETARTAHTLIVPDPDASPKDTGKDRACYHRAICGGFEIDHRTKMRRRWQVLDSDNPFGLDALSLFHVARFLTEKSLSRLEICCRMNVPWVDLYNLTLFQRLCNCSVYRAEGDGVEKLAKTRFLTEHLWEVRLEEYLKELQEPLLANLRKTLNNPIIKVQATSIVKGNDAWILQLEKHLHALSFRLDRALLRIVNNVRGGRLMVTSQLEAANGEMLESARSIASVFIILALNGTQHLILSVKHQRNRTQNTIYWVCCPTHNWLSLCVAIMTTPNLRTLLCDPFELMITDYRISTNHAPVDAFARVQAVALRNLWTELGLATPNMSNEDKALNCARFVWSLSTTHQEELTFLPRFRITAVK